MSAIQLERAVRVDLSLPFFGKVVSELAFRPVPHCEKANELCRHL